MGRASATAAAIVTTALHLLALHGAAEARPLLGQQAATPSAGTDTSALALAPAAGGDAAARAGKWLPFAAHHVPAAAYWAHRPMPWFGVGVGAPPSLSGAGAGAAVEGGDGEEELVRGRERDRPYVGGGTTTTRQEQLAMWASLLNHKGKERTTTSWLPVPRIGEAADDEPAKAATDGAEGAEMDDPAAGGVQVGQTKSGFYWGNNGK